MSNENRDKYGIIEHYYKSEYNNLLRYAERILMNDGLAEDAVQDTFQIAMGKLDKFAASPNPIGWLYETLKFVLKHAQRDRQRYLKMMVSLELIPEENISADEIMLKLTTLYGDDDEIKLLIMFYGYGFTVRDIADMLGITEGACKMRIRRGRTHQKNKINKM